MNYIFTSLGSKAGDRYHALLLETTKKSIARKYPCSLKSGKGLRCKPP